MTMLIDTHCHLDFPDFVGQVPDVIARARAAGVGRMITISTHLSRFEAVHSLALQHPDVWCTVGVHPHEAAREGAAATTEKLVGLAASDKVVGIGECGLDYFYDKSPRDEQQASFRQHIRAAVQTDLPLIIHTRDADQDTADLLREEGQGRARGVLHCFSSGRRLMEQAVEMGFYISLSGILTFKKSEELREIARDVPMDRLLVETDSPYLAPVPLRGKTNEPAFTAHTAAVLADVKGVSVQEIAARTTENALRLFDRMPGVL
jgi:TatD DNase family protein